MSALPPKADILRAVAKSLLLTQSGHSLDYAIQQGCTENQCFRRASPSWAVASVRFKPLGFNVNERALRGSSKESKGRPCERPLRPTQTPGRLHGYKPNSNFRTFRGLTYDSTGAARRGAYRSFARPSWTLLREHLRHPEEVLDLPVGLITMIFERHPGAVDPYHVEAGRFSPDDVELPPTDIDNLVGCQP